MISSGGTSTGHQVDSTLLSSPDHPTAQAVRRRISESSACPIRIWNGINLMRTTLTIVPSPLMTPEPCIGSGSARRRRSSFERRPTAVCFVWEIQGLPFVDLEYGSRGLIAARVKEIGQQHDDVEIVTLDTSESTLGATVIDLVPGLGSIAVGEDGVSVAYTSQLGVGEPVTITVTGPSSWSTTLSDIDPVPIAVGSNLDAVYVRQPSTSHLRLLHRASRNTTTDLQVEVFSFDASVHDTVAYSNPNFTGGPGKLCFAEGGGPAAT